MCHLKKVECLWTDAKYCKFDISDNLTSKIKTWDSAADQIEDLKDKQEDLFFNQTTRPGVKHVRSTTTKVKTEVWSRAR